jgi:hypothetical protein
MTVPSPARPYWMARYATLDGEEQGQDDDRDHQNDDGEVRYRYLKKPQSMW